MKIIYHLPDLQERSTFDENITKLANEEMLKIACPFIDDYFDKVISKLAPDFQLLTDINALIKSKNTKNERENIYEILSKYKGKIRHCEKLHAKCIISPKGVFLGSANLTKAGICNNNELSVIIDSNDEINQINKWFDEWWAESTDITDLDINNILKYSNNITDTPPRPNLITSNPRINCYYEQYHTKNIIEQKDEVFLVDFLKHINNRSFINSYCDLAKRVFDKFDIQNQNPRLCITFRRDRYRIPITIGQRYILNYNIGKDENFCLIMSVGSQADNFKNDGLVRFTYFTKNKKDDMAYGRFNKDLNNLSFEEETLKNWENAVEKEIRKSINKSNYRKHHQDILYRFITDIEYRNEILSKI